MWKSKGDFESVPQSPIAMPQSLWRGLYNRGYQTKEEIDNLFSPSLSQLRDPFTLNGMKESVARILKAYDANEKIAIYADFDLDGTSGLCLLYESLTELGFDQLTYYQPKRLSEGYGLHTHAVEDLKTQDVSVIITVDVGITAIEAAARAKELNIDLIITDHHLPYEELPKAFSIINPNTKECTSRLGFLSGAGVAFYLLLGIRSELKKRGHLKAENYNPKSVLDFFIIGTLTDLVPLVEENRVLVKHGLKLISNTQRAGLKSLMSVLNLMDREITSQEVAINLAPKLNALSRMESDILPRDVLLEKDFDRAQRVVGKVLETQELRKKLQKYGQTRAIELKQEMNQEHYVWIWSHEFHKGIIGLVATKLTELYSVPVFVGSLNEEGKISGSCRLPQGMEFDLTKALQFGSETLEKYGGHSMAAGFTLKAENALLFDTKLKEYMDLNPYKPISSDMEYDSVLELSELTPQFMKWHSGLEPFGKDFPKFIFKFEACKVDSLKVMNGGHYKIFWTQSGTRVESVIFSPQNNLKTIKVGEIYHLLAEPKWNHFLGRKILQLNIVDVLKI